MFLNGQPFSGLLVLRNCPTRISDVFEMSSICLIHVDRGPLPIVALTGITISETSRRRPVQLPKLDHLHDCRLHREVLPSPLEDALGEAAVGATLALLERCANGVNRKMGWLG